MFFFWGGRLLEGKSKSMFLNGDVGLGDPRYSFKCGWKCRAGKQNRVQSVALQTDLWLHVVEVYLLSLC